ncbi:MAG: hypothetical protein ACYDFU_09755, partial [Nitrospirota bacterium]
MKKFLLTIAVGMLMLSLPVIASAAVIGGNSFDEYSGFTASITVHGFKTYSTAAGATAGFKQFSWTEKADKTFSGPKNTLATMSTTGAPGQLVIRLNAHTLMIIPEIFNAIAPANGKVIHASAIYIIYHTTGALTLDSNRSMNIPTSAGLTGAVDFIEGSCTITAYNNPTTHNMVLSIAAPTASLDYTDSYTSVSGTPDAWISTGINGNWVAATVGYPRMTAPAVSISPIMLA